MPSKAFLIFTYRAIIATMYVYTGLDYFFHMDRTVKNSILPYLGCYGFLTSWSAFSVTLYFISSSTNDLLKITNKLPTLTSTMSTILNVLFFPTVFASAFFVTTMFWMVYFIDHTQILYKIVDELLVPTINHMLHSLVALVTFADLALQPRKPINLKLSVVITNVFIVVYYLCFLAAGWLNGRYHYPIMNGKDVLTHAGIILFMNFWWNLMHIGGYKLNEIMYEVEEDNENYVNEKSL